MTFKRNRIMTSLAVFIGIMFASCVHSQPLNEKLAVESMLPVYLNQDKAILMFERKEAFEIFDLELSFIEQNSGHIPTEPVLISLSGKARRYEHKMDISSWLDGEYKVFISEVGNTKQVIVRGIIKQTIQAPVAPTGIIDMSGINMLFVDDWYIESESGVKRQVQPAELIPVAPWETDDDYFFFRNSIRQYWIDVDGNMNVRLSGANMLADKPIEYWVKSKDMRTWEVIDNPLSRHSDCSIENLRVSPAGLRSDVEPKYRYYDKSIDGDVDLEQVRIVWSGTQRDVKWGDYDIPYRARIAIWEKSDGLRVILGEPITQDKSEFKEDEIGNWTDTNDNFGDLRFSNDGKTIRCYQARLIPAKDPFKVHYDNIMANRVMVTWSSNDGLNWKPTLFDAPTFDDPWSTQHYGVDIWWNEDKRLELAYHKVYDVQLQRVYTELVYSRDGVYWNRFDESKPFMDNGAKGQWNFGYSITTGNRTRMAYDGYYYEPMQGINVLHFMFLIANNRDRSLLTKEFFRERFDGKMMGEKGFQYSAVMSWYDDVDDVIEHTKQQMFTPGFMKYRKDGWVSASAAKRRAIIDTKIFRSGGNLRLNAKTTSDGFVAVEVLDRAGNPMKEYSGVNSAIFSGDSVGFDLVWSQGNLKSLPSEPFKLRITLENSEIYSLQF